MTIDQVQGNTGLFTMPIQLRVTTDQGTEDFTVQNSQASEQYVLQITGMPEGVALDPDRWILRLVESQVTNPTFDAGILLVNGVHWGTYGAEITTAYDDSTFWGDNDIDFWDCFGEPAGGYPSSLPPALGHGTRSQPKSWAATRPWSGLATTTAATCLGGPRHPSLRIWKPGATSCC